MTVAGSRNEEYNDTLCFVILFLQDNADDSPTDQCSTQNQVDGNDEDEVI